MRNELPPIQRFFESPNHLGFMNYLSGRFPEYVGAHQSSSSIAQKLGGSYISAVNHSPAHFGVIKSIHFQFVAIFCVSLFFRKAKKS